jgi:hypothetical protein
VRANPPAARAASVRGYGATTLKLDPGAVTALLSGTIRHTGGIALTAGATTVTLENFVIDPLRRS